MDIATAQTITSLMGRNQGGRQLIEAIQLFRKEVGTPKSLVESKNYLTYHSETGRLFEQLCADFVHKPEELLFLAYAEKEALDERILKLEAEVAHKYNIGIDNVDIVLALTKINCWPTTVPTTLAGRHQ